MKGVGPPVYHLGGDFQRLSDGRLSWGSKTYIEKILDQYGRLFPREELSKKTHTPLPTKYHPEDVSALLDIKGIRLYQSLIGMLQWAVTLGRYDIQHAVMTMSRYRDVKRQDHLDKVKSMFMLFCPGQTTVRNTVWPLHPNSGLQSSHDRHIDIRS